MNFFTKNKFLFSATLAIFFSLFLSNISFAQPANDDCANAEALVLYASPEECVQVTGNTVGATASPPAGVCSGSWYQDDVWYSFTTGNEIPEGGITIKTSVGGVSTDCIATGMALYTSCDENGAPIACFSTADPNENELYGFGSWFTANTTYYVRVWSGGSPSDNSGTFRICAYGEPVSGTPDVVVWEGSDFDGGLPMDWEVTNGNANDTSNWYWTTEATRGAWGQSVITSPTYANGWMAFDGDFLNNGGSQDPADDLGIEWVAHLTSPIIDCSTFGPVKLKFYQNYRDFNSESYVEYSLDGGSTYERIEVNSEIEVNDGTPAISEIKLFLPALAGQPNVKIRLTYEGTYYYWLVDDIQLVEPECNNLRINSDFVATAPYAHVPSHSVTDFPLIADVYNNGGCTQTGTVLNVQLTEDASGDVVYEANKAYGDLPTDSLAENQLFDELATAPTAEGSYTLTYNLSSDSTDFDPSDNTISAPIVVTANTFALDNGTTNSYQPAGLATVPAWMDGNIFHTGDLVDGSEASVQFGMSSSEGLIGQTITVLLYEWINSEEAPDAIVQIDERTNVGFNVYEITGDEPEDGIISLPFYNPLTGTESILEDNKSYVVLVQWAPPAEGLNLFLQYDEKIDFAAAAWATEQTGLHKYPTIGVVAPDSGNFDEDEDWNCGGASYGNSTAVPVIRLIATPPVSTENVLAEENLITLYPNPVVDQLTIQMNFVESVENVRYDIYDINGKLIQSDKLSQVQQSKEQVNTKNYAPGTYHLKVISDLGVRAIPFVVQK
jgi:hypothetical protein